jgi:hypothetical protein
MMAPVSRRTAAVLLIAIAVGVGPAAQSLPTRIDDRDFWALVDGLSEAGAPFVTDNRISNEIAFQHVIPELQQLDQVAYLGVGPEQNFTYITALKPRIAFIVDIRRQNLLLHLTYKALVELSADRTEFMSRLFARPRPGGTGPESPPQSLFSAYANVSPSEALAQLNLAAILEQLKETHGFPLSDEDEQGIAEVYRSLYQGGPDLKGNFGKGAWIPSYAQLMSQSDLSGRNHSFLASEADFLTLKAYQTKNLIVPVVGDFSGPKAIRGVGRYLGDHGARVTTFYLSNVEEYLFKSNSWNDFIRNVSSLPIDDGSMFIRTYFTYNDSGLQTLLDPIRGTLDAFDNGRIKNYTDVVFRSKAPAPAR